jgi:hypothetical protein
MNLQDLKNKPLWQMTGEEFIFLNEQNTPRHGRHGTPQQEQRAEKRYVYGIRGIAHLFNCSIPTASRIKASCKIDGAIKQISRKIVVDADLALELAGRKTGGRK